MGGEGGGRLLTFSAFRMGAYSRWALIRGWALIRINTVLCLPTSGEKKKKVKRKTSGRNKKVHRESRGRERREAFSSVVPSFPGHQLFNYLPVLVLYLSIFCYLTDLSKVLSRDIRP